MKIMSLMTHPHIIPRHCVSWKSDTGDVRCWLPENTSAASYVTSVTAELEENTMFNKVAVSVIFGPKCIFDASKHSN